MTRISSSLAGALALVLLAAAVAAAQEPTTGLLTRIEVKQLIARGEAADHARLRDHFAVLADVYTADSRRHESMGQALTGNPNRRAGENVSTHCTRLAKLAGESAAIARELVAHHDRLAAGVPSTPPSSGAAFEQGAGAPAPRPEQMSELAARAHTRSDHTLLAEHFADLASRYESESQQHAAMAVAYRSNPRGKLSSPAAHCERLVRTTRAAAAEARAQAGEHRRLAAAAPVN